MFTILFRNLKEAGLGITRNLAMAISAASAVSITLILIGAVSLLSFNLAHMTNHIQQNVEMLVKIDNTATDVSIDYLEEEINKIDGIISITFSSKDEELEKFIDSYGDSYEIYRGANNPMRNAFYVRVENGDLLKDISDEIVDLQYVEDTNYGGLNTVSMINAMNAINSGGLIVAMFFVLLAGFLIYNTIKIAINGRKTEISIMRSVGATNGYIRRPFVFEGMIIGFIGSIIPILLIVFGYRYVYIMMDGYIFTSILSLAPPVPMVFQISLILVTIGMLVGFFGSVVSVTKHLKQGR